MADVFLSYAREDRAAAQRVALALERRGYNVWWDPDIPAGPSYTRVIEEALKSAKCVLVLWSSYAVASNWVQDEATEGQERGVLVAARLADVKPPLGFRGHQLADLSAWGGDADDHEFRRLLRGIESHVLPVARPASEPAPDRASVAAESDVPRPLTSSPGEAARRVVTALSGGFNGLAMAAVVAVVLVSAWIVFGRDEGAGPAVSGAASTSGSTLPAGSRGTASTPTTEPTTSGGASSAPRSTTPPDFIDRSGETVVPLNGVSSHGCPDGYAMGGAIFGGNDFWCRYVGAASEVTFTSVSRGGVSLACSDGFFMTALNVEKRLIRCSRTAKSVSAPAVVSARRDGRMTECAGSTEDEAAVVIGYDDGASLMLCGRVSRR